jgi:glucose/mannose-6-phosphate isomerase
MTEWPTGGTGQMYSLIQDLPRQLEASADLDGLGRVTPPAAGFRRVLLCGMGGSAIAADLVQPLLQHQPVSLDVWRDYGLPHWVDPSCLVIVASYSGHTEESLSALAEARSRGCPIIGITSGGKLAAAGDGLGGDPFPFVTLPGGLPPRASLGFGLGALVRVLGRLGLVNDAEGEIAAAVAALDRMNPARLHPVGQSPDSELADEPAGMLTADGLAQALHGRIPVIYTVGQEALGAGVRLKGQINENSKCPACLGVFPELNHNDLVGWELDDDLRGRFVLLILGGRPDNVRLAARVQVTCELLAEDFPAIHEIHPLGDSALARVLSLVQYGDYLSCHLARLKGVDPVPVDRIGRLKDHLARLDTD